MLNYEVHYGTNNRWVVFLHGIGGSVKTWKKQIDAFKEYNLLLLDLPGHGESEIKTKITVKAVNQSIKETLDELHIKKADFVALSLGTIVAVRFALEYPTCVRSLVLGGSVINIDGTYKKLMKLTYKLKSFVPHHILYQLLAKVILPKRNHTLSRRIFVKEALKMSKASFFAWLSYSMQILHSEELIAKLKSLKIKICFISGSEDRCFLSGTIKCVRKIGQCNLKIIKNCGHVCSIEKAQEFNVYALKFLEQPAFA